MSATSPAAARPPSSRRRRPVLPLLLLLSIGSSTGSGVARATPRPRRGEQGAQIAIRDWRLNNGLRVIYAPHRRVPAVTVQVWYHAGSKDERPGIRGVAHMFEHMMFKGSKRVRPEAHARMISAIGGSTNAFTSQDVTAYHNTLPRQYLDFALQLEAERMRNLLLTDATIKSEREVVKEEKRVRLDNSPIGRTLEAIHALAYDKHPYAWTPAGDIPDLDRVTRSDCQAFYDSYYRPNNATLIVVGDVTEAAVRAGVAKHFGDIAPGPAPTRIAITEPPQRGQRRRTADWPSQLAVVLGAYHIPPARHPDIAALKVATAVLATGRSSRIYRALVRTKKAVEASGFVSEREHPGLMFVYAIGLPSHDLKTIEEALLAEVARLGQRGPRAEELRRARNQLATAHLRRLQTNRGIAHQIGTSALVAGDPRAFLREVSQIDAVKASDIKRVVRAYLRTENLSLVLLPPK